MPKQPDVLMRIDTPERDVVRCRVPLSAMLHNGRHGTFKVATGRFDGRFIIRSDAKPLLCGILTRLQEEATDIVEISGHYLELRIRFACDSLRDQIVRHIVLACQDTSITYSYENSFARSRPTVAA